MDAESLTPGQRVWVCDPAEGIQPQRATVRRLTNGGFVDVELRNGDPATFRPRDCHPTRRALAALWSPVSRQLAADYDRMAAVYRRTLFALAPRTVDPDDDEAADEETHDMGEPVGRAGT